MSKFNGKEFEINQIDKLKQQRRKNVDEILKELNIGNNNKVLKQYQ